MPRYMDIAAEANVVAKALLEMIPDDGGLPEDPRPKAAELIARLVNLGVRCSPRGVQHTVRLNAVKRAVQDLPVRVTMEERVDEKTKRKYNALVTQQLVDGAKLVAEGMSEDM